MAIGSLGAGGGATTFVEVSGMGADAGTIGVDAAGELILAACSLSFFPHAVVSRTADTRKTMCEIFMAYFPVVDRDFAMLVYQPYGLLVGRIYLLRRNKIARARFENSGSIVHASPRATRLSTATAPNIVGIVT